jgi:anti-sigma B factor antagonist
LDAEERSMSESLYIETPSAPVALSLIERLNGFHAEVVPCDDERFQVRVDLDGRRGSDRALLDSLERIERWLESSELDCADVRLNGRSYRFERSDQKPPRQTHAEVDGLVVRMRTVPLGPGVQVVSAEGDLDLHTSSKLDQALESTDHSRVILDLTEVPFVDSTALGTIVASTKRMRSERRDLIVVAGNPVISRVLSVTGLERVFSVHDSLSEAITTALDGNGAGPDRA